MTTKGSVPVSGRLHPAFVAALSLLLLGSCDQTTITVAAVGDVRVSPGSGSLAPNGTLQLSATPRSSSGASLKGRTVSWSSGNNAVATVDGNGMVTGVFTGQATVTANIEGVSGTTTINVGGAITTSSLSEGAVGVAYNQTLVAIGGTGSYSWSLTDGTLPNGLNVSSGGVISGTPTQAGTSSFTVQVTSGGASESKGLSITINDRPVTITTSSLPDGTVGEDYSETLLATGGTGSYAWSLAGGSLPTGLGLSSDGVISGAPTQEGTGTFTVQVVSGTATATKDLTIVVTSTGIGELGVGFGDEQFELIPAGTFQMGSDNGGTDELPIHTVNITRPFYMQKTEVTQGQWQEVMAGENPTWHPDCGHTCPVEMVSLEDVELFLFRLNQRDPGRNYRLPTEAEWEYASRAGTTWDYGGTGILSEMGWYDENSGMVTHPVALKEANDWGLYDMHGNVWEWVSDWYSETYYAESPANDPTGPEAGENRLVRGGGFDSVARQHRSAERHPLAPDHLSQQVGLRLVRDASGASTSPQRRE